MTKKEGKYPIGLYVQITKDNHLAKIIDANYIECVKKGSKSETKFGEVIVNEWLYDVEYLDPAAPRSKVRYYESDIGVRCKVLEKQDLPKAIYD